MEIISHERPSDPPRSPALKLSKWKTVVANFMTLIQSFSGHRKNSESLSIKLAKLMYSLATCTVSYQYTAHSY